MSRPTTTLSRSFHSVLPAEEQFDTFGNEFFNDNSAPSAVAPPTNSANSSGVVDNRQSTMIRARDNYAARLAGLPAAEDNNNIEMDNASVSSAGTSIFHGQAIYYSLNMITPSNAPVNENPKELTLIDLSYWLTVNKKRQFIL